jgi:serine/threonine protein kinase
MIGRADNNVLCILRRGYQSHLLFKHVFHLEDRWTNLRELGQGAYGLVISAEDSISGEKIAIKLLTRVFDKVILARRCLREITLMRHLNGHENVSQGRGGFESESCEELTTSCFSWQSDYRVD